MNVLVYSRLEDCPYCIRVKKMLKAADIPFEERQAGTDLTREELKAEVKERIGVEPETVPVVFVDDQYIGGCDEFTVWFEENKEQLIKSKPKEEELDFGGLEL